MASRAMLSLVGEEQAAERRRSPRFRVMLSAKLVTTTDEHSVDLRNVSATGALAKGIRLPAPGQDVVLRRGAVEAFARVVWSDGTRCGLEFEEQMPGGDLLTRLKTEPERAAPPPVAMGRPSLRPERLTEEELALVREWAQPAGRSALRD